MVIQRKDMKSIVNENMRGGEGAVRITHLVDTDNEKHTRMLGEVILESGCSIGYHVHENETEYYFPWERTRQVQFQV